MDLTDYGKRLLGSCAPKDSLEHTDPSLAFTKDLPNQYVRDTGSGVGNSFEFQPDDDVLNKINTLLSDHFELKLPEKSDEQKPTHCRSCTKRNH